MRAKTILMAAATITTLALGGCANNSVPTAEVEVRVNVCVDNGLKCFALLIPSADILVETVGGQALGSATTNEAGRARVPLSAAGAGEQIRIKATSPLLDKGSVESTLDYPKNVVSVTLQGGLAQAACSERWLGAG